MSAELGIQKQISRFLSNVCNLGFIGFIFAISRRNRHRLVGVCLRSVGLQSLKNIEISCLVLKKQCRSWKLSLLDKADIYSKISLLDKSVSDPQISEHICPDYEDLTVFYFPLGVLNMSRLILGVVANQRTELHRFEVFVTDITGDSREYTKIWSVALT